MQEKFKFQQNTRWEASNAASGIDDPFFITNTLICELKNPVTGLFRPPNKCLIKYVIDK